VIFAVIIFGILIGSFSNVVIYRMPRKLSIIKPGSHCVACNKEIKWHDNIPLISYVILKGKCRYCRERISLRYPLVEGLYGLLYGVSYLKFGLTVNLAFALIFITIIVWIMFIDLDFHIIPDTLNISLFILGIIRILYLFFRGDKNEIIINVIGFIGGFLLLFIIRRIASMIYKREAMGYGDVKLLAGAGLNLGIYNILLSFGFSTIIGAITALILLKFKKLSKGDEMAFGPFLVTGMIISLFFGSDIISWYINLFV